MLNYLQNGVRACIILVAAVHVVPRIHMLEGVDERARYFKKNSERFLLLHSSQWIRD